MIVQGGIGGLLLVNEQGSSYQVSYDGNGNVSVLTDSATGLITGEYEFDPFGGTLKATGAYATTNPFQYSTKYTDPDVGLIYFGYRYHSPRIGRWINRDPAEEEGGVNLYSYLENDTPNSVDKLGLYKFKLLFDAFIHKKTGEWMNEPWSYNAQFKTDLRDFGQFDENADRGTGNARLYSIVEVESTQIGKLQKGGIIRRLSNAGNSHRRVASWIPLMGKWQELQPQRAEVNNPEPVIKDTDECCSTIWFKPAAAYPYVGGPNIDYSVVFTLKKENSKEISVELTGTHNQFPFYEGQVNSDVFYKYEPQCWLCDGPGLYNLNSKADPVKARYVLREK